MSELRGCWTIRKIGNWTRSIPYNPSPEEIVDRAMRPGTIIAFEDRNVATSVELRAGGAARRLTYPDDGGNKV